MKPLLKKLTGIELKPTKHTVLIAAIVISIATYLLFFYPILSKNYSFWGSDVPVQYYPPRVYLYETILKEHRFPFWTEKLYSGFPIYADMENAYLDIPNILSIILLGPMWSYKLLHFLEYLAGSLCIFFLLKRKGHGLLSFFIANLVYYFSFFHLNHQIHFNVIIITYLLPVHILLADLFLEKRKVKYIVLQSLVLAHGIYWGHPQFTLLIAIAVALYLLISSFKKISFKIIASYLLFVAFLSIVETLPLSIPAYQLFKSSRRNGDISYLQGSLPPNLSAVAAYPYLFGKWNKYKDPIDDNLTYTETYIYVGISALLLAAAALIFLPKTRFVISLYSFIWLFVLLGFMRYAPIWPYGKPPLIELFRYWDRAIFVSAFGIGILAGMFVEALPTIKLKDITLGLVLLGSIFVYLLFFHLAHSADRKVVILTNHIIYFIHSQKTAITFIRWKQISLAAIVSIAALLGVNFISTLNITVLTKGIIKYLKLIISLFVCALLLTDLLYFGEDVLLARIKNISDFELPETPLEVINKRILYFDTPITGNGQLYLRSWSLFGYNQFLNKNYHSFLAENNISCTETKCTELQNPAQVAANLSSVKKAGVYGIVMQDSVVKTPGIGELDVLDGNYSGSYITKREGDIKIKMTNPAKNDLRVNTFLRSDKDWYLFIDGKISKIDKSTLFMAFNLPSGEHTVHFKFIPYSLYKAMGLSLTLCCLTYLGYFLKRDAIAKFFRA